MKILRPFFCDMRQLAQTVYIVLFRNYAADLGFAAQDISRVLAEFSAVTQKIFKLGIAENDTPYMRFLGGVIGYYAIRKSA